MKTFYLESVAEALWIQGYKRRAKVARSCTYWTCETAATCKGEGLLAYDWHHMIHQYIQCFIQKPFEDLFVPVQNRTRRAMKKDVWGETGFAISSDESPEKCELTGSSTRDVNEKWTASFDWTWNHQEPNVAIAENSAFHFACVRAVTCSWSLMKRIPGNRANCVETEHLIAQVCQFFHGWTNAKLDVGIVSYSLSPKDFAPKQ